MSTEEKSWWKKYWNSLRSTLTFRPRLSYVVDDDSMAVASEEFLGGGLLIFASRDLLVAPQAFTSIPTGVRVRTDEPYVVIPRFHEPGLQEITLANQVRRGTMGRLVQVNLDYWNPNEEAVLIPEDEIIAYITPLDSCGFKTERLD